MRLLVLVTFLCVSAYADTLIWSDEFNELDTSVWEHEITLGGGGNWEFEWYSNNRSTSFVKNGILNLNPILTAEQIGENNVKAGYTMDVWGSTPADMCTGNAFYGCERSAGGGGNYLNPIQSAAIRTTQSFSFKYGRLEVRAKLPQGDWIWPAIWMLPRYNAYGNWPASGEIDIVESRGNDASYPAGGLNTFGSTLHWGPYWAEDPYSKTHAEYTIPTGDLASDFHVYGLTWSATGLTTYIDSQSNVVLNVTFDTDFWTKGGWGTTYNNPWDGRPNSAPFDQKFYIIFNVAVGGTGGYFPDGVGGKPWQDTSANAVNQFYDAKGSWYPTWKSPAMQIDYVRVYQ